MRRIVSASQLDELFERSRSRPVWLFKHSLTCSISTTALDEFRRFAARLGVPEQGAFAVLEIQKFRPLSAEVERRTGVVHQSPQAILVAGGTAAWSASHWRISQRELEKAHERAVEALRTAVAG